MNLTNLYHKALEKLQVIAAGESADPGDTQLIADKYASLYAMLRDRELVSWAVADDVPDGVVLPLVAMLAFASAGEFGIDPSLYAAEGALDTTPPSLAERQLRQFMSRKYVSQPARPEYF